MFIQQLEELKAQESATEGYKSTIDSIISILEEFLEDNNTTLEARAQVIIMRVMTLHGQEREVDQDAIYHVLAILLQMKAVDLFHDSQAAQQRRPAGFSIN